MAYQLCSAQPCFSLNKFPSSSSSSTNNCRTASFYACAQNASRRIALFQLTTVLSQSELFVANGPKFLRSEGKSETSMLIADIAQETTSVTEKDVLEWTKRDKRRLLHVVYRVGDLDKTIKFYTECLGMKLLRQRDIPEDKYSNAFVGYGPEDSHFAMELTYRFGHFGIAVEDVAKMVDLLKNKGVRVIQEPGLVEGGNTVIALVQDPDGYNCKLIQRGPTPEPLCQVMLRVGDLERSINFYRKAYGMELLQKSDNPELRYTTAMMGYGPEGKNAVLELTYNYGVREYNKGNGYGQIAVGTDDVYKTAEAIKFYGGEVILEPGPLPGINTKITVCLDPDGWKTVFVDNIDFLKELE
ncbi:putative lactoylglutathione lyase, chloroplastic [Sesamum alatum]|uniref:lactoylglutathione lyase n=1 Tax=Sesamum alatum TaxID=300844 RepID=A0AAE1XYJ8_9LAMI|nr:putative lactoylglutathione lyase, chloroplastic [Sesamum alatum]